MDYKTLFRNAERIKKYFRNISLEEARLLGLEDIILELNLRKKTLDDNVHFAVYLFEYWNNFPLAEDSNKRIVYKYKTIAIIYYLENSNLVLRVKTKNILKSEIYENC